MLYQDRFILMGLGGLFLILGLGGVIWGRKEEKNYYNSLSTHADDLREFMEHWPQRPQPGATKVGGWIAVAVGVILLATGGAIWIWG